MFLVNITTHFYFIILFYSIIHYNKQKMQNNKNHFAFFNEPIWLNISLTLILVLYKSVTFNILMLVNLRLNKVFYLRTIFYS